MKRCFCSVVPTIDTMLPRCWKDGVNVHCACSRIARPGSLRVMFFLSWYHEYLAL